MSMRMAMDANVFRRRGRNCLRRGMEDDSFEKGGTELSHVRRFFKPERCMYFSGTGLPASNDAVDNFLVQVGTGFDLHRPITAL